MKNVSASDIKVGEIYWYYESADTTRYIASVRVLEKDEESIMLEDVTPCVTFNIYEGNGECDITADLEVFTISGEYTDGCLGANHYFEIYELTKEELFNNVLLEIV